MILRNNLNRYQSFVFIGKFYQTYVMAKS